MDRERVSRMGLDFGDGASVVSVSRGNGLSLVLLA